MMQQKTLLCVDDETSILRSLKRLLIDEDYQVLQANSGEEGLALLADEPVHVVMSDQRMPEMTGTEFLQIVKERYPQTVRIVLSGYADISSILEAINRGEIYRFLGKPWEEEELKMNLRQCFEHYDLLAKNQLLLQRVQEQNQQLARANQLLENAVHIRSQSLQLSQEILELLPLALLGVDSDGNLTTVNKQGMACAQQFGDVLLGEPIESLFSVPIAGAIKECMATCQERELVIPDWRLQLIPLPIKDVIRGCIAIFNRE